MNDEWLSRLTEATAVANSVTANDVSNDQKNAFKRAFHKYLWAYLYHCDPDNRQWISFQTETINACVAEGKSFDETLAVLDQKAKEHGRV